MLLVLLRFYFLFLLLLLLLKVVKQLQSAELLILQAFVFFVDNDSHKHLNHHFIKFLADLVDLSVLVGLDVVNANNLGRFYLFLFELVNVKLLQPRLQLLLHLLLKGHADLHLAPGNFVALLKQLDAVQSLLLGWLVELQGEMNILYRQLDVLGSESALGRGMNALLYDDLHDVCENVSLLGFPFLVADLQLAAVQNDLDDFSLGLAGEELVEICLFGKSAVRCVLINLFDLQNLRNVFFKPVSPVHSLVAVAGDFEIFVIDLVANGCHIGHLHFGVRLLQHYSFIN